MKTRTSQVLFWIAILSAWFYPTYLFPIHNPNERVRIYMTAAMWDYRTFAIGYRAKRAKGAGFTDAGSVYDRWGYVNDKALVCNDPGAKPPECAGTLYSAKAPGSSFLSYPFYALISTVGKLLGKIPTMEGLILYLRLMVVLVPSLLMLVLMRRFGLHMGYDPVLVDLTVIGVALGSMVLTYSHMLAGHQIAAWLLFFAFLCAWKHRTRSARHGPPGSDIWALASGLLAATAVCVEYPMVLMAGVIFVYLASCRPIRFRPVLFFGLAALLPAALTAWYHYKAFGHPFRTPYSFLENPQFIKDIAPGIMGLRAPRLENLYGAFVSPFEGMFFFAPWLSLVLPALLALRRPRVHRWPDNSLETKTVAAPHSAALLRERRVVYFTALAACACLALFIASHSLWRGGWTVGPRYIVPFVPFAALVILEWLDRVGGKHQLVARMLLAVTVIVSVAVTGACSLVSQGFHTAFFSPLTEAVIPLLKDGYVTFNLGNLIGLEGGWSAVPLILMVVPGIGCLLWRSTFSPTSPSVPRRIFLFSLALLLSTITIRCLMLPTQPLSPRKLKALAFMKENFYPFDATNADLRERRLIKEQARRFPRNPEYQIRLMNAHTASGHCAEAFSTFHRYLKAVESQGP